jgi:hypothetical protein
MRVPCSARCCGVHNVVYLHLFTSPLKALNMENENIVPEVDAVSSVLDHSEVAAGPVEAPAKKQRNKKKSNGDFLKNDGQIKRRDQIKAAVKTFKPIITQAKQRNANESDTANIVHKFFQDVLGWDFMDLTTEFKIKSTYCDLAIKVDGEILLLIEVKAIGLNLKDEHVMQASNYASNEGVQYVLLTNMEVMRMYEVTVDGKVITTQVWEVDFSKDLTLEDFTELYLISKHGLPKGLLDDYAMLQDVLSEESMIDAFFSDEVVQAIAKYLREQNDVKVDVANVRERLEQMFGEK